MYPPGKETSENFKGDRTDRLCHIQGDQSRLLMTKQEITKA